MKRLVSMFMMGVVCVLALTPLVFWAFNPTLTKMQIFLKFWPLFLIMVILVFGGGLLGLWDEWLR